MGRFIIFVLVLWVAFCAVVFGGLRPLFGGPLPLGFVVFGLVPPGCFLLIRLLARLLSRKPPPIYYGPL